MSIIGESSLITRASARSTKGEAYQKSDCCSEVGKRMLADGKGGSIINIASGAGLNGIQDFPVAYQATKAAVINLTRNLASSWGNRRVRVNAIAPGWFPSEITEPWFENPVFLDHVKRASPMGRIGAPSELAGALLLLASDASSFITGHTLVVDGGASSSMGVQFVSDELSKLMAKHYLEDWASALCRPNPNFSPAINGRRARFSL
jgi:enoyl-[acyl-carrier-protein] reductase (NADH)